MTEDPNSIVYFAETNSRNRRVKFGIKLKDRSKHMYIIGKTGMGKSTLLENLAAQDIKNGHGIAFIDPHGKTAELLLEYVPEERIKDVLYFAPFDMENPVSFNVMEDVGPDKRHLVANGLMSAFKKIWVDAWSARMEYILNNILLALLEYPDSTLLGVNRMLADEFYRKKVVANTTDPAVKAFWTEEFAKYGPKYMQEAGAAIQNKIGQFISNPLVRNMIGQSKSTFDIRKMMDEGKIIIVNLSKGRVGEANANLIGGMLITKIYLSAMSRADIHERELQKLPNFYLFVDEFQNFANESFADILSEARKYKLNLIVAHQYIEQMTEEVRAAIFGNVGTMITFRVGAYDAEVLEKEFAPYFTIEDMVNLGFSQIYLKLMIDGVTSKPFSASTLPPIPFPENHFREQIIAHSRKVYGKPRAEIEDSIKTWHEDTEETENDNEKHKTNYTVNRNSFNGQQKNNGVNVNLNKKSAVDRALEVVLGKDVSNKRPRPKDGGIPKLEIKDHNNKEVALDREKDLRKAISLSYLRQKSKEENKESKKVLSQKHLVELRSALADVVKDMTVGNRRGEVVLDVENTKQEIEQKDSQIETENINKKEVKELPEDVLKRILEVD